MANLTNVIKDLMSGNTEKIRAATGVFQETFKHPQTVNGLVEIIVSQEDVALRQYAALLLKKRIDKLRHWLLLSTEQKTLLKSELTNRLWQEDTKIGRKSLASLVGVMVRHEGEMDAEWMQNLMQHIRNMCIAADVHVNEVGSEVLLQLLISAPDQFINHVRAVCELFMSLLINAETNGSLASAFISNIISCMNTLVPHILGHSSAESIYQRCLPTIFNAFRALAGMESVDPFINAFDFLENMAEYTPKLFNNYLRPLIEFCSELSTDTNRQSEIRIQVLSFVATLVRTKKKAIVKAKLHEPIIQFVFSVLASEPDNDASGSYFGDSESSTPLTAATQTMDIMSLNFPAEKLISCLLQLLEPALQSSQPLARRGALLSMAVVAEGCSDLIARKYLSSMLIVIRTGLVDNNTIVRNASFFALGQFAEHLQPEIAEFAPDIMPLLFQFWQQICVELANGGRIPWQVDRLFYAIEMFCETLEADKLAEYMPVLMENLFVSLSPTYPNKLQELTLVLLCSICQSAKIGIVPYFGRLVKLLQSYLSEEVSAQLRTLRPQAIDALAALTRAVGADIFQPLSESTLKYALTLLQQSSEPEEVTALYNLIAGLTTIIGDNPAMAAVIPVVVNRMQQSILSSNDAAAQLTPVVAGNLPDFNMDDMLEEIDLECSDDESDTDSETEFAVENAYLEEKEEAIASLKEISQAASKLFMPYLEDVYETVYKVVDHPQEDIRKSAIEALSVFILVLYEQSDSKRAEEAVALFVPKLGQMIKNDEEVGVVLSALECFGELLRRMKCSALPNNNTREIVFVCIREVLLGNVNCQSEDGYSANDDDYDDSEYDEAILESATNLIPIFGQCLTPETFSACFDQLLHILLLKLEKSKRGSYALQRSYVYGAIAECFASLKQCIASNLEVLLNTFTNGLSDKSEKCRQNVIFGLGELVYHSQGLAPEIFVEVLKVLVNGYNNESHESVLDNIGGAISRLILTNHTLIPLADLLPTFLHHLPIKEDYGEQEILFKAFKHLMQHTPQLINQFAEQIISIVLVALQKKACPTEQCIVYAQEILLQMQQMHSDALEGVLQTSQELAPVFVQHVPQ